MAIERWSPFREFPAWDRAMRPRFTYGFRPYRSAEADVSGWSIPLDISRDGDEFVVKGALPGVKPEDIDITIENRVLTLAGRTESGDEREEHGYLLRERRSGAFRRSLRLPGGVDPEKAASTYEHGVVTIRLPMAEERKAKRLTLSVADPAPDPDPTPAA